MSSVDDGLSTWTATRLVARREFTERLRDRGFLVSTAFTLAILLAVLLIPKLFNSDSVATVGFTRSQEFTGRLYSDMVTTTQRLAALTGVKLKVVDEEAVRDPAAAVRAGTADAVVTAHGVVVDTELNAQLAGVLQAAWRDVHATSVLSDAGVAPATVTQALGVAPLAVAPLTSTDPRADQRKALAFTAVVLLYGQIIGYGFWVALGVVEEKSSRVVEIMLSAIPSRALLAGKILGIGLLGLLQLTAFAIIGLAVAAAIGSLTLDSDLGIVVASVLGWFVLAFGFYSCGYALGAARVSRQEDLQNVTTPMTIVVVMSFFAAIWATGNPNNPIVGVLSVLPPFSALVQPPRIAAGAATGGKC